MNDRMTNALDESLPRCWIAAVSDAIRDHVNQSMIASAPDQTFDDEFIAGDEEFIDEFERDRDKPTTSFALVQQHQSVNQSINQSNPSAFNRARSVPGAARRRSTNQSMNAFEDKFDFDSFEFARTSLSIDSNDWQMQARCLIEPSFYSLMEKLSLYQSENLTCSNLGSKAAKESNANSGEDDDFYDRWSPNCSRCRCADCAVQIQTNKQSLEANQSSSNNQQAANESSSHRSTDQSSDRSSLHQSTMQSVNDDSLSIRVSCSHSSRPSSASMVSSLSSNAGSELHSSTSTSRSNELYNELSLPPPNSIRRSQSCPNLLLLRSHLQRSGLTPTSLHHRPFSAPSSSDTEWFAEDRKFAADSHAAFHGQQSNESHVTSIVISQARPRQRIKVKTFCS